MTCSRTGADGFGLGGLYSLPQLNDVLLGGFTRRRTVLDGVFLSDAGPGFVVVTFDGGKPS